MAGDDAKRKLVDLLKQHVFERVINARPEDYPEGKRGKLAHVQRATETETKRFEGYESAEKVVDMYRDDLSSRRAKDIHRELHDLGLPSIEQVRGDFERLANELGVAGGRSG